MRCMKENDFEELEVREVRRGDASRSMETGVLRSDNLNNKLIQDKGDRLRRRGVVSVTGGGGGGRNCAHCYDGDQGEV